MNVQSTATVPPKIGARSPLTFFTITVSVAAIFGIATLLYFFDPTANKFGFYPVCIFHQLTGWNCPGCGATRALYALLHGKISVALHDNALLVLTLAVCLVWLIRLAFRKIRGQEIKFNLPAKFLFSLLIIAVVFGILRNLPAFHWLSP